MSGNSARVRETSEGSFGSLNTSVSTTGAINTCRSCNARSSRSASSPMYWGCTLRHAQPHGFAQLWLPAFARRDHADRGLGYKPEIVAKPIHAGACGGMVLPRLGRQIGRAHV